MTGHERTIRFLRGEPVDHPPFHPIIMRWAARYAGVKYRDFCLDYAAKCGAMIRCAEDFDADWVTVMSDPYCEAEAFGLQIEYVENDLPLERGGHLADLEAVANLKPYDPRQHARCRGRIREIEEFQRLRGNLFFIVGWVEGPIAEYGDLRGLTNASMDFYDDPDAVHKALDVITDCDIDFISLQVKAGAHCVGIGDAFCSQIGPDFYREFAFAREKRMVDHLHALGAIAKLHICGNTSAILPDMIRTGADIIDVDHLVPSMAPFAPLLGPLQVFSGKCDPVAVIQNGSPAVIAASVAESIAQAGGRCIVSAGCEVPPDTSAENFRAFSRAARSP
ncbi:MAG TPA: uroporphyrinogen decarboxylase family protein [Kiritimatiellia bacterium]|nr:uroporphyrinogen decarboxylase family protein [Kiritimatiellia bacterium]